MKVVITGASGQLGREFQDILDKKGWELFPLSHRDLPIESFEEVLRVLKEIKPDIILNCAAYNYVDKAEDEWEVAFKVNSRGPLNLAVASREINAKLVHYSTDYVFDGGKDDLYQETDEPNPLNQYGRSKLLGERWVLEENSKALVFRVSWVYGNGKQNFIFKLLNWAKERDKLLVTFDEFSVPTWTRFIAENTLKSLKEDLSGLFHLVPQGLTSRFHLAQEVFKLKGLQKRLIPVPSSTFNLKAKRPRFSAMDSSRLQTLLNVEFRDWAEYLKEFLTSSY